MRQQQKPLQQRKKRVQRVTVVLPIGLISQARDATMKVNGLRFAHLVATGLQLAIRQLEKEQKTKFVATKRVQKLPVGRPRHDELAMQQWKVAS